MFRGPVLSRVVRLTLAVPVLAGLVAGCSMAGLPGFKPASPKAVAAIAPTPQTRTESEGEAFVPLAFAEAPARTSSAGVDGLISKYASVYGLPESLVRRVVQRESGFNPGARNGPYYGLMQIRHDTARSMGYGGSASGLLDAETNLKYAVKYLRGAYITAGYNSDGAVRYYSRGYYYDAKRLGLLEETGLR
ncbi:MAG TPA: lytic transglycosylase domain-containing protein [Devosia sp.]|jgi:soluble lytic murein transglycosylase-like protein|nr:lytic transglycosylase domain-containing protein [Devosia sp.]HEV2518395.1 lytic transglycosylase domain-containing protein [Devosia sp.]